LEFMAGGGVPPPPPPPPPHLVFGGGGGAPPPPSTHGTHAAHSAQPPSADLALLVRAPRTHVCGVWCAPAQRASASRVN